MKFYTVNRSCPVSGDRAHRIFGYVSAAEIGKSNETYKGNFTTILGIDPEDRFPVVQSTVSGCVYAGWDPPSDFLSKVYEDVINHSKTITDTMGYRANLFRLCSQVSDVVARSFKSSQKLLKCLDFGCGYGTILDLLNCRDLVCYGYEPSMKRRDSQRLIEKNIFTELDQVMSEGPFDLIICTEVLEHLSEPRKALDFMRRNAHPKTLLAITVPQCEARFVKDSVCIVGDKDLPRVINPWEHLNYFSSRGLRDLLDKSGFEVVYDMGIAEGANFLPAERGGARYRSFASAVKRILSNCFDYSTKVICRLK